MDEVKQNRTYYFYNDIKIKQFESKQFKIDKNHTKTLVFTKLTIITIKKIDDCKNIYSLNPLYLLINHANGYIEEKGVNKYLIFDYTDENKELLKI